MDRNDQLVLALPSDPTATFVTYATPPNEAAAHFLQTLAADTAMGRQGFLWGPRGVGKTHLLQAFCHAAGEAGAQVGILPLGDLAHADPAVLEGLEQLDALCLDDLHVVAGSRPWEMALFTLVNACRERGTTLLMSAAHPPRALALRLPDLASRLVWGSVFGLENLDDSGRMRALRAQAHARGFTIPEEVMAFLLRHGPRRMDRLVAVLDALDRRSLVHKRRVTIPLAREVLALSQATGQGGARPHSGP